MSAIHIIKIAVPAILLCSSFGIQQDCARVKKGEFYYYPPTGTGPFRLIRKDSNQYEVDMKTKDTSVWKVYWVQDCVMTARFVSTTKMMSDNFLKNITGHQAFQTVEKIAADYYLMKMTTDSINSDHYLEDTVWFKPK